MGCVYAYYCVVYQKIIWRIMATEQEIFVIEMEIALAESEIEKLQKFVADQKMELEMKKAENVDRH